VTEASDNPLSLSGLDASALDALIDAGWRPEATPAELRARAGKALDLLSQLDAGLAGISEPGRRELLKTVTLARISRTPAAASSDLSLEDAASVDALVEAGWDVSRVSAPLAPRAARAANLVGSMDAATVVSAEERAERVERTLALIQSHIDADDRSRRFAMSDRLEAPRARFSLRDAVSVAAAILLGFAVLWPIASSAREDMQMMACQNTMQNAGVGFGLYAQDFGGRLPLATAGFNGSWWNVGTPKQSNSANLFELARTGHAKLADLACAGRPGAPTHMHHADQTDWRDFDEVSYSYQLPTQRRPSWTGSTRMVVMADKSPIIERARFGERFDPDARSRNHGGRGQNVLFNDGSVAFIDSPVLPNGDNIWLPTHLTRIDRPSLSGTERPDHDADAFVGP
jgi:hypothetical protein